MSKAKKLDEDWLRQAAFHYLARYATNRRRLVDVLTRKARRRAGPDDDPSSVGALIAKVVSQCEALGLIDDGAYARMRVESMRRAGTSRRMIRQKLLERGLAAELVDQALADPEEDGGDPRMREVRALIIFARRKRIGPFADASLDSDERLKRRQRDLAKLARAGYEADYCRRLIDCADEAECADWLSDLGFEAADLL